MAKLNSLSLFVGTGNCNAYCDHCAGVPLRKYAPKKDGDVDEVLIQKTIEDCYEMGARYLSISSSGEPTLSPLSVTKTLKLIYQNKEKGIKFSPINMYSNGIRIGNDKSFRNQYLSLWKSLGLTTFYITVHDIDEKQNAEIYGVKNYPPLEQVVDSIHEANLKMRVNIVLSKTMVGSFEKFVETLEHLNALSVDAISAWPIRDLDDKVDKLNSPSESELDRMEQWLKENPDLAKITRVLRESSKVAYTSGQKLTLFPDGTLSNTWCNN